MNESYSEADKNVMIIFHIKMGARLKLLSTFAPMDFDELLRLLSISFCWSVRPV